MAVENYRIGIRDAERIPCFYFPGAEENGADNGLEFVARDDDRPNPMVLYSVKGFRDALCTLILQKDLPVVQFVDITGADADIDRIRGVVEGALEISLRREI